MVIPVDKDVATVGPTELEKRARRALAGETQGIDWEQAREQICQRSQAAAASPK